MFDRFRGTVVGFEMLGRGATPAALRADIGLSVDFGDMIAFENATGLAVRGTFTPS